MFRHKFFLAVMSVVATAYDQRETARAQLDDPDAGRNVILVVSDGLRWQEVFFGADSSILFGDPAKLGGNADIVRRKFWRPSVSERRAALMPFVWGTIARDGQLFGNRSLESRVQVTNGMKFSYPGYNEMLVGSPDPRIDRNDYGPNPNVTVFEWLNQRREFKERVAAFGTWDVFRDIFNVERSRIHIYTNGAKPHDNVVQSVVLPYLKDEAPRALFIGYAETDDFGHEGRYDRFLDAAHAVDQYIAQVWSAAQSDPRYRGRTTLIFTADHGRGRTAADWTDHGKDVPGAEESFIVEIGPDIPARGERRNTSHALGSVAEATASAVKLTYSVKKAAAKERVR